MIDRLRVRMSLVLLILAGLGPAALADYEVDHAALIREMPQDPKTLKLGRELYHQVCVVCHGTREQVGSLPTALRFGEAAFKNGHDPRSMYRTLTQGFNQMVPQPWMTPEQKYAVIHYIRETFLKKHNPSQYFKVDRAYLDKQKVERVSGDKPAAQRAKPWIKMNYGPNLNYTFEVAPGNIAYKAIAVRLDPGPDGVSAGRAWIVYDHDTMRAAVGFVGDQFCDWRSIGMDGSHGTHPHVVGDRVFVNPAGPGWAHPEKGTFEDPRLRGRDDKPYGPLPRDWAQYRGLYHHGNRVVLHYTVGTTAVLESPALEEGPAGRVFVRTLNVGPRRRALAVRVAPRSSAVALAPGSPARLDDAKGMTVLRIAAGDAPLRIKVLIAKENPEALAAHAKHTPAAEDLSALTKGGPPRWTETVVTQGKMGGDEHAYTVDEITTPFENPYRSWMRLTGFDFYADGDRAAVSTWHGDVWRVSGLKSTFGKLTWTRIASGLFQPLGVKVIDDTVYAMCRDQLVILRDLNDDGETDYYECFNSDHQVTEHFHEFAMGLQTDAEGNFYYAKSARHAKKALVPHHGTLLKISKDGQRTEILATGFRAANGVCLNGDGTFFVTDQEGHWTPKNRVNWVRPGGFYGNMMGYHDVSDASDAAMQQPLVWLTNKFNRSPGELVWARSKRWGPLEGALLEVSYGMGRIYVVPHERVGGRLQGGEYALPHIDFPTGVMRGRFHPDNGQFYVCGMFAWAGNKRQDGGFYRVRYTGKPICLPLKLHAHRKGLRITFSSPLDRKSAANPEHYEIETWDLKRTGGYGSKHHNEKALEIDRVSVSSDGRTVDLHCAVQPTWGMRIKYRLRDAGGRSAENEIHATVHELSSK